MRDDTDRRFAMMPITDAWATPKRRVYTHPRPTKVYGPWSRWR